MRPSMTRRRFLLTGAASVSAAGLPRNAAAEDTDLFVCSTPQFTKVCAEPKVTAEIIGCQAREIGAGRARGRVLLESRV